MRRRGRWIAAARSPIGTGREPRRGARGALLAAACALLLGACAARSGTPAAEAPRCGMDLRRLLADELALRPAAEPVDLYVLLREALLGPAAAESEAALAAALADLAPSTDEPLIQDLDEVRGTVRLNLRRWLFIHGTARHLHAVVARSAGLPGDPSRLAACAALAPAALEALGLEGGALERFLRARAEEGWPPAEHSEKYRTLYRPAYRVVLRGQLPAWVTAPPPTTG